MDTEPLKLENIEVEVYYGDESKDSYFVKVLFIGLGMYINSFSVKPSDYGGYWVQPPAHRQRGGFTPTVDFDKAYPTWSVIEQKALEAVEDFKRGNKYSPAKKDVVVTDIPDGPIKLEDIPF